MKQRILVIYTSNTQYVSLLHCPKNKQQLDLWVQAELCKEEFKNKPWDLFKLEKESKNGKKN